MPGRQTRLTVSPARYPAAIFDLDGVITRTAAIHAAAWKALFDAYLARRGDQEGRDYAPFTVDRDYPEYVDGKPRYAGVQAFLQSRGIELPYGDPGDGPERETVCGLGNRKNELFRESLEVQGVAAYADGVGLVQRLRRAGCRTAVVSSSRNCARVLAAAGLEALFDARVDGVERERLGLAGKPEPDMFLEAARRLDATPARCLVVEDATAGVEAAARGGFGCVVGVDRAGHGDALRRHGAHIVVTDLAAIAVAGAGDD